MRCLLLLLLGKRLEVRAIIPAARFVLTKLVKLQECSFGEESDDDRHQQNAQRN